MSAQTVHPGEPTPLPRTQNAVAAALPPAARMEFFREMGDADENELVRTLRRWWMRACMYADPLPEPVRGAIEAGTAVGHSAAAAVHSASARRAGGR